jgi:fatty-acyl-CoA synthase
VETTFAELLLARAEDDNPGLRFEDETYSWRRVVMEAKRRAGLLDKGVHIGVLLENVPEYVFWIGAAALSGATLVGINPTRRGAELAADIRHTDCELIVTDAGHAELLAGLDTGVTAERTLLVDSLGHLRAGRDTTARPQPADPLLLLFTSGSTGAPKAVACSQGRLATIGMYGGQFGIGQDSVTYIAMPLFHGNSVMANLAMAVAGGATVVLRRRFSASGFLGDIRRYGVTYFNYVGRALAYILATPEEPDDAENTLRTVFGTEASAQDMKRFGTRFGCQIVEGYGSSEGVIALHRTPETPPDALGVPGHGVEVAVLDPETGAECARARFGPDGRLLNPSAAIGELVGRNVAGSFEGYYNNPEADAERVRDGHYWSGDLGYRDEAGFFYFAGRGNDRLRVDSENFAAAPVERILARWDPVVMCAVYPVPDPRTGDQVMAALELRGAFEPDVFADFLKAQPDLGTKWAPRFLRIVESMPLTSTNKVDKRPLRHDRWEAGEVWWRPGKDLAYEPFTQAQAAAWRAEFNLHGRGHVLSAT